MFIEEEQTTQLLKEIVNIFFNITGSFLDLDGNIFIKRILSAYSVFSNIVKKVDN